MHLSFATAHVHRYITIRIDIYYKMFSVSIENFRLAFLVSLPIAPDKDELSME